MMMKHQLLRSQRNEIYQATAEEGLNPADFEWIERESIQAKGLLVPSLIHRPTDFYFIFDLVGESSHWAQYSPGATSLVETQYPGSWVGQKAYALTWLRYVKREVALPDLWSVVFEEKALVEASMTANTDNTQFSKEEKLYIKDALREIREYIHKTNNLSEEQVRVVGDRFNYLEGAVERVGRKDWVNLALATMVNIILIVTIPPEPARELMRFAGQVLHSVLKTPFLIL
jgi:hypothetical protein